jgi:acyl carrier protein
VKTREEILSHVMSLMTKMFNVEPSALREDASLYEDFDIDSIDAVDLMVELTSYTGKKVTPDEFRNVRTIGDVVTAVETLLKHD